MSGWSAVSRRLGRAAGRAACACLLALAPGQAISGQTVLEDAWYVLYLNGGKAGHLHEEVTERSQDGRTLYDTQTHEEFAFGRAGVSLRHIGDNLITEDADGRLVAFRQQVQGAVSLSLEGKVEGDELVITSSTAHSTLTKRLPAPEGLCPWALRRLGARMGLEPGTQYEAKAFVPEAPDRAVRISTRVLGREAVQVFEVTKRLFRRDSTLDIAPGLRSSEWVDAAGTVWLIRVQMPGVLTLESRRATRELALAPDDPADILAAAAIPTDKPIRSPRRLERLQILLGPSGGAGTALPDIPSDAWQRVERVPEGLRITVRRASGDPGKSYALPYAGKEYAALLRPNVWMEADDPAVANMSREAVSGATDALTAARRIEDYVESVIKSKDLSLGFATAAEAAAQKAGDCTEHAVLVAALARAAGVPSRVVGGLAYSEALPGTGAGGFGYHMWAEAYVGEWLPLDAALGSHDATHIAVVRSDLNEPGDLLAISSAISQLFGRLKVRVLEAGP
jgi:transglutaminase-like putative cysteine protease